MKKKFVILTAAVALVGLAAVSFSLAFFTDRETAANVVTTGNVNIAIDESITVDYYEEHHVEEGWKWTVDYHEDRGLSYKGIVPGDHVTHIVDVNNIGENDAYLRLKVKMTVNDSSGKELPSDGIKFYNHLNEVDLGPKDSDGYYLCYYDKVLKTFVDDGSDADVIRMFDNVKFPASWSNAYADASVNIEIIAEAVQSDYVDVGDAIGVEATKKAFGIAGKNIEKYNKK